MPSLPQVRPEPRAVLAWPWRVLVLLILAGPPCILAVVAALAYTGRPELKVWLDWMQLCICLGLFSADSQLMDKQSS
ncbi:hypothetical protein CALCODRAFT_503529 [Calocera cornea HHB12733]|uniref:Uncharacterized protein n=1 Tax=Calocera cornea HHB12733 TaxID=1353952 RepID=A0A165CUF5_9BASI|nr:hypothetical protein CALCODRAFT_503529 [Calocera cornea HHB12733]